MINVDITRLSSKGQVVIPRDMRKDLSVGEKLIIIKKGRDLILKPATDIEENFIEDMDFAKKTLEALDRYGKGKYKEMSNQEFLDELEKW